jgi:flagellar biosynthetic protein FliP
VIYDSDLDFDDASTLAYLCEEHKLGRIDMRAVTVANNSCGRPQRTVAGSGGKGLLPPGPAEQCPHGFARCHRLDADHAGLRRTAAAHRVSAGAEITHRVVTHPEMAALIDLDIMYSCDALAAVSAVHQDSMVTAFQRTRIDVVRRRTARPTTVMPGGKRIQAARGAGAARFEQRFIDSRNGSSIAGRPMTHPGSGTPALNTSSPWATLCIAATMTSTGTALESRPVTPDARACALVLAPDRAMGTRTRHAGSWSRRTVARSARLCREVRRPGPRRRRVRAASGGRTSRVCILHTATVQFGRRSGAQGIWRMRTAGPRLCHVNARPEALMSPIEQTKHVQADPPQRRSRGWGRFALHYLEMVVAMFVGMLVLGGALRALLAATDVEYSMDRQPELMLIEMGCTMAIGMLVWMRIRRHGWPATLEMSLAMLLPGVAVAPLVGIGAMSGGTAMVVEHVVMFPLMLLVMLRRSDEYLGHRHG